MATYQIAFRLATKDILIQADGAALPSGFKDIGSFTHDDVEVSPPGLEFDVNHVLFQHIRDALYHTSAATGELVPGTLQFPDNITDMAGIQFSWDATAVSLGADLALTVGDTAELTPVFTPNTAFGDMDYVSDHPEFVTVTQAGFLEAVAAGSAVITGTYANGIADTVTVTVTEPEE